MTTPFSPRRRPSATTSSTREQPQSGASGPRATLARSASNVESTGLVGRTRLPSLSRSSSGASSSTSGQAAGKPKPPFRFGKLSISGGSSSGSGAESTTPTGSPRKRLSSTVGSAGAPGSKMATASRLAASTGAVPKKAEEEQGSPRKSTRRIVSSGSAVLPARELTPPSPASIPVASFGAPKQKGAGSPSAAFGSTVHAPALESFKFPAAKSKSPTGSKAATPKLTSSSSPTMSPSLRFPTSSTLSSEASPSSISKRRSGPPAPESFPSAISSPPGSPPASAVRRKPAPLRLSNKASHNTLATIESLGSAEGGGALDDVEAKSKKRLSSGSSRGKGKSVAEIVEEDGPGAVTSNDKAILFPSMSPALPSLPTTPREQSSSTAAPQVDVTQKPVFPWERARMPSFSKALGGSAPTASRASKLPGLAGPPRVDAGGEHRLKVQLPSEEVEADTDGADEVTSTLMSDLLPRRPYAGLGLGLPFSVSEASGLNAIGSAGPTSPPSAATVDARRPSEGETDGSASPSSPVVVDRTRLVGLGELATPRWAGQSSAKIWGTFSPEAPRPQMKLEFEGAPPVSPNKEQPEREIEAWEDFLASPARAEDDDTFVGKRAPVRPKSLQAQQVSPPESRGRPRGATSALPPGPSPRLPSGLSPAEDQSRKRKVSPTAPIGRDESQPLEGTPVAGLARSKSTSSQRAGKAKESPATPLAGDHSAASSPPSATWTSVSRLPSIPSGDMQASPSFYHAIAGEPTPFPQTPASDHSFDHWSEKPSRTSSDKRASQKSHHRKSSGFHHQHSPSVIAHSILKVAADKSTDRSEDMESVAARDGDTADALRKLDGLSAVSPRVSRQSLKDTQRAARPSSSGRPQSSGGTKKGTPISSRPPSPGSASTSRPGYKDRTKSDDAASISSRKTKARSVVSAKETDSGPPSATEEGAHTLAFFKGAKGPVASSGSSFVDFPTSTAGTTTTSPKTAFAAIGAAPSRRASHARFDPNQQPLHDGSSSLRDFKRGSSSSTSYTAGTSTGESRESTSATSLSGTSNRSPVHKRRSSGASETSSAHSGEFDRGEFEQDRGPIPPVPPLPKDYEAYSRRTSGAAPSPMTLSPFLSVEPPLDSPSAERSRFLPHLTSRPADEPSPAPKTSKKWSLSAALGIHRTPSFSHDSPSSSADEYGQKARLKASHDSHLSDRSMRASISTSSSHSGSGSLLAGLAAPDRTRTVSTSTVDTDATAGASATPSRQRTSVLAPRRTPSGIPFFNRSASHDAPPPAPQVPAVAQAKTSDGPAGRKSILGLNVFARNTTKKPAAAPSTTMSSSVSMSSVRTPMRMSVNTKDKSSAAESAIPTYRRNSIGAKATNLIARKRGKTLSSTESPKEETPPPLPPIQMPNIDPATADRVQSLAEGSGQSDVSSSNNLSSSTRPPRVRTIKESATRRALPTIAGSPARAEASDLAAPPPAPDADEMSMREQPLPSLTPTKIPRAVFRHERTTPSTLQTKRSDASMEVEARGPKVSSESATSEFGMLPTASKRAADLGGSLIPRTRSVASSTTSRAAARRPSKGELKQDENVAQRRPAVSDHASEQAPAASTLKAPPKHLVLGSDVDAATEPSAAARLEAARRTVAKTQEAQAARLARRLSGVPTTPPSVAIDQSAVSEAPTSITASRSSRTISNKLTVPTSRMPRSSTQPALSDVRPASSSTSRGGSIPPPATPGSETPVTEDEVRGDEEMAQFVRRQQQKKMSAGATQAEVHKLFELPQPTEPKRAMSAQEVLRYYRSHLSDYERGEILDYDEIYHIGIDCGKKAATRESPANNFGYDDDRGDYLVVHHDHLLFRYEVIDVLGKGSFGQVLQCRDHRSGDMVAVKIIRNRKRFHNQALVEIKVLENLLKWDPEDRHCVLRMTGHFSFRGHLCIVNELLSINLYELIRNNGFHGFSTTLIRRFTVQILQSLSLLRHHRVVHCDLKPENILLKHPKRSAIKTIDFGSSCFEHEKVYTYIQSRFYRSPEVILGMNYHMAIDMWSLGCILAEMHTGYPIFPGDTENEQLACIMEVLGMPDKYLVDRSSRRKVFFDSTGAPRPVTNPKGRRRRVGSKTLQAVLKTDDDLFVDFISKCLAWDPERRLKPDPAMRHPWIAAGRLLNARHLPSVNGSNLSLASSSTATTRRTAATTTSTVSSSGISSTIISTPRRKQPSATASSSSASNSTLNSTTGFVVTPTAPSTTSSTRTRTQSQSTSGRLQPRGGFGLAGSIRQTVPVGHSRVAVPQNP